jgi:signal transduction histidine kinase
MPKTTLEPGLLKLFRLFLVVQLLLIYVNVFVHHERGYLGNRPWTVIFIVTVVIVLLLLYLSLPGLQERLGWAYLPIAILGASIFSLLAQDVLLYSEAFYANQGSAESAWQLFMFLFIPLVLVGWQYGFKAVLIFCICSAFVDHFLLVNAYPEVFADSSTHARLIFIRTFSFLFVGFVISRIVQELRQQRLALQQANEKLVHHAATLEQLSISRERNRMASELHDTLAHTLSGVAIQLEGVRSLWVSDPTKSRTMLEASLAVTRSGLTETRKAIQSLRASPIEDLGIRLAVQELARSAAERAGFRLRFVAAETGWELPADLEQCIYRVAQEALENIVRHAGAREVSLSLSRQDGRILLVITDDGGGFDVDAVDHADHYGLRGMRERAEVAGGHLSIESRPGQGACVRLEMSEHA